ncbi:hypothetical protein V1509DRAFT_559783 [Lipomyces kononenkoae]
MPPERELFPGPPPHQSPPRSLAGDSALNNTEISASLDNDDSISQTLHDLNLTNHDRDQIPAVPPQVVFQRSPAPAPVPVPVPVPRINTSIIQPNQSAHVVRHASPSYASTRQPTHSRSPNEGQKYSSTAPNEATNLYRSSRYPPNSTTAMNYPSKYYHLHHSSPQYSKRFARLPSSMASSVSPDGSSSMRSPIVSPSISSGSSFASSSSSSSSSCSSSSSSSAAFCERDLFPQATQFDLRIPMLPDPSPLAEPSFFFSASSHIGIDNDTVNDDLQHARQSSQSAQHMLSSQTLIEKVGILASAARPAGLTISDSGAPSDTPIAVRVQFREDMLFGDGGCIDDDDDCDDDRPVPVQGDFVTSTRESEYDADADEDDVPDAPDLGHGDRTRTTYGRRGKVLLVDNTNPRPLFLVDD